MRAMAIYVASALAIWFAIRFVNHHERYELLQSSGIQVTGSVIATACANHDSFSYAYDVHGRQVTASGKSSSGGLDCGALRPGMSVPVTYLAASPAESVAGSPAAALSEERLFAVASSLFFPAVALWLWHRKQAQERVA